MAVREKPPAVVSLVEIVNQRGLHARAAAKFVKLAASFDAEITVTRNQMEVPGNSIMGLMMLAAAPGVELEVKAVGPAAREAVAALCHLVATRFGEDA